MKKILNKSFIALSISLSMFGILITGCAAASSQSQQAELIALNRTKFIPEVELFGEKIPLTQSQQYLLTSNQYSVELDSTEAGGSLTTQKGEQPFITFGRSSAPIYTVKLNKPSIVAEVHIIENMKMVTKSSKKGVVLLTLVNDDKTRLQDVIFFTNKNRNMKSYSFGFKETVDVMSKELSLGSSNFFNEFYIGISSVYISPLFDTRGDIIQITSPHTIKVFSIAKDDIYSVAEELLKKRNDREKNENLIRAIAQNDQTKYLSLYAQKNSFLLPDKSITRLPSDADPKYAVSNYDNIVNTGKYKTVQGKTEKMDLSAFSASKTEKEEKHSSNQQVETISTLHKEPEKKVETKFTSKPVFSSTKEIEKIKLGEDNSSDGALGSNTTKKRDYVDLSEGAK